MSCLHEVSNRLSNKQINSKLNTPSTSLYLAFILKYDRIY